MSNTIQGAAITPETPLQASVAQGPVIINDYVIDLQEVPEGVQLTVRKGSEEQTAVIPMGGSDGVSSWNDLTDRPFGEVYSDTLRWDGNTEGLESADGSGWIVSDKVPTMSDLANGGVIVGTMSDGRTMQLMFTASEVHDVNGDGTCIVIQDVVRVLNFEYLSGVAFMKNEELYISSFNINGYTGFSSVKKLDAKYLPGAAVLYANESMFLYATDDTSDTGKRMTRAELLSAMRGGSSLWISFPTVGLSMMVVNVIDATLSGTGNHASAVVMIYEDGTFVPIEYYTAEYTPESTASE